MNKQILALSALAVMGLGSVGTARSQEMRPMPQFAMPTEGITVSGHGEVKVKPDIALLNLTVTTQSQNQADAVRENAARTTALMAALRGAKIAEKDIQTLSYTVQPQYDYKPSPPVLTGYQVQNSVQATVRDLTKVGLVIDTVTAAKSGSAEVGGVSFDLSDKAASQSAALRLAVGSAKLKAGVMADAAGVGLGRLLTMTEGVAETPRPVPLMMTRAYSAAAPAPQTPIADQQITVSADAVLVYAMGAAK